MSDVRDAITNGKNITVKNIDKNESYEVTYNLSPRQEKVMLAGGLINTVKHKK